MPKSLLIVNPVSGKGRAKTIMLDLLAAMCAGGEPAVVCVTEKQGDASSFAAKYGPDVERIVCTGGDGTLNEVISGLMTLPRESRPAIGYIPLGTTNDMANSLSIPKNPSEAIAQLESSLAYRRYLDVGQLGSDYFGYVAAFGTFTNVPFTTPQTAKNTWGYLAYVGEAISKLSEITSHHTKITYDGGFIEEDLLFGFVTNTLRVAGGLVRLPEDTVALDDGQFEVLLIKKPRNLGEFNECVSCLMTRNFSTERVMLLQTSHICFEFDEDVQWTRDGEDGGIFRRVEILNHQQAVRIFV